jgi:hypothetical protein
MMKRFSSVAVPLVALMLASCPTPNPNTPQDPYQTARTTISIMQTTLETGKLLFDGVASAMKTNCTVQLCTKLYPDTTSQQYKDCLIADNSVNADFKKCYTVGAAVPWVEAGVRIGVAGCQTAREAVQLSADLATVREDKKLKAACASGDQAACTEYNKRVDVICTKIDPTKGDEYKACVAGKPVAKADYTGILQKTACLAYESFKLVPVNPKYDLYINGIKMWLKGYGNCSN